MERNKIIELIESGRQVGVSRIIEIDGSQRLYTYAIQKFKDKFITYSFECDLDNSFALEMEEDSEIICVYDTVADFIADFNGRYGIVFDDFNVSKGQKFFYVELYI